jgi:hypothetical protein
MKFSKKQNKKNQKKSRLVKRNFKRSKKSQNQNFQIKKQIGGYDNPDQLPVIFEINNSKNEQYSFSSILGNPINPVDKYFTTVDAIVKENAQPRINSQSGWTSSNNEGGWISIDLLTEKSVAGIAIQGKYCGSFESIVDNWEGLNNVFIKTSKDYKEFMEHGDFKTNIPKNDKIQYIFFKKPVQARFIIISASNYVKSISIRVDALLEKKYSSDLKTNLTNLEDIDLIDVIDTDAASLVAHNLRDYLLDFYVNDSSTYTFTSSESYPNNDVFQPQINSPYGCVFDTNDTQNILAINLNTDKEVVGVAIQGFNCLNMTNCEGPSKVEIGVRNDGQDWKSLGEFLIDENYLKNNRITTIFFERTEVCQYIAIAIKTFVGRKAIRADALIYKERLTISRPQLGPAVYRNCSSLECERWLPFVIYSQPTSSLDETWIEEWNTYPKIDAVEPRLVLDFTQNVNVHPDEVKNYEEMLEEYKILRSYNDHSERGKELIKQSEQKIADLKASSGDVPTLYTEAKNMHQEEKIKALVDVLNYCKYYYMVALHMYKIGNYVEAALQYRNAIHLGHIPSRAKLAWLLIFGREGIPQSVEQAYELVKDFNDNNNDCKSIRYFIMLFNNEIDKTNKIDGNILFELVKEISDKTSNMYANYCLGFFASEGSDDQNKYFHRSAQQGLDSGLYSLGLLTKNQDLYNKSAEQGFPLAIWQLAYFYIERNDTKSAIKFFLDFLKTKVDNLILFQVANAQSLAINVLKQLGYELQSSAPLTPDAIKKMSSNDIAVLATQRAGIVGADTTDCVKAVRELEFSGRTFKKDWQGSTLLKTFVDSAYFQVHPTHRDKIIDALVAMRAEAENATP